MKQWPPVIHSNTNPNSWHPPGSVYTYLKILSWKSKCFSHSTDWTRVPDPHIFGLKNATWTKWQTRREGFQPPVEGGTNILTVSNLAETAFCISTAYCGRASSMSASSSKSAGSSHQGMLSLVLLEGDQRSHHFVKYTVYTLVDSINGSQWWNNDWKNKRPGQKTSK